LRDIAQDGTPHQLDGASSFSLLAHPAGGSTKARPGQTTHDPHVTGFTLTELTAFVVASFLINNTAAAIDVPKLLADTYAALLAIEARRQALRPLRKPAVPIEESITDEHLVCLDDGHKLKSLKRHLRRRHGLSPDEYRLRWGLPDDYPMVAPSYAALRSSIARRPRTTDEVAE
jgi:predicted transcriptional regulator